MTTDTITFMDCLMHCAGNADFVREFDRLTDSHLSGVGKRSPLDQMIDKATGRDNADMNKFITFVYEFVWSSLPEQVTNA